MLKDTIAPFNSDQCNLSYYTMIKNLSERARKIVMVKNVSQKALSEACKLSETTINRMLSVKKYEDLDHVGIKSFIRLYNVLGYKIRFDIR